MILYYLRTAILYLVLIACVRLMGKRQVGQMEPSEFVVTILVANLASIPMQDEGIPLFSGLIPILTVLGAELVLSALSMGSIWLRKLLCGKPVILIENGRILQNNLRRTRITVDELTGHLRLKEVLDLKTVQYAILETNGGLSVFLYPAEKPATAKDAGIQSGKQSLPVTIIDDGRLLRKNLPLVKKDEAWVDKVLRSHHSTPEETFLLTVDGTDKILWLPTEGRKSSDSGSDWVFWQGCLPPACGPWPPWTAPTAPFPIIYSSLPKRRRLSTGSRPMIWPALPRRNGKKAGTSARPWQTIPYWTISTLFSPRRRYTVKTGRLPHTPPPAPISPS